ncbi:class I SAM-dependent methyltransferase [Mesorhizobium onobrychidis]|uniref:Methyltransferase domain-containing protein n=1 Tax=Mesorhizobium onobrychidis TaxID=2775404 RepID=A0ABY5QW93_9HYPH|nr:methyltransferase domain-containing protein [Mesorhizobium onobrychidis]UVC14717.1 methyltransferase domain-containing protein [Mesorhizobium onobrychidis]
MMARKLLLSVYKAMPPALQKHASLYREALLSARLMRTRSSVRECNVCGYVGNFKAFGFPSRLDARCPQCNSLERHRLFKMWFDENKDRIASKSALHFAPETAVTSFLKPLVSKYVTADLYASLAEIVLNIEAIDLPDNSFDLVICSHVLEHVDDRKALREMHRILTPGGIALLMTPVIEGWPETYENPAITSPQDRALHYGQFDHVRYFGSDIRARITDAGFALSEYTAVEPYVHKHALTRGEKIFVASKADLPAL